MRAATWSQVPRPLALALDYTRLCGHTRRYVPTTINIRIRISFFYCADPYCKTEGALHSHYIIVLVGAVCTVEKERFQSSAKGRCRLCSFQFSRQLVPRSRCGGGKCSIRRKPAWSGLSKLSTVRKIRWSANAPGACSTHSAVRFGGS